MEKKLLQSKVLEICQLLEDCKAKDVKGLDLQPAGVVWADYSVICTCNSLTHARGVLNELRPFLLGNDFHIRPMPRSIEDATWCLVDAGSLVVHLMNEETRQFYDLERLWLGAEQVYPKKAGGAEPAS